MSYTLEQRKTRNLLLTVNNGGGMVEIIDQGLMYDARINGLISDLMGRTYVTKKGMEELSKLNELIGDCKDIPIISENDLRKFIKSHLNSNNMHYLLNNVNDIDVIDPETVKP